MSASRIYVAGHQGLVGSAFCRLLGATRQNHLILASRKELDLLNQAAVNEFFNKQAIDEVYIAAGKVGGIYANQEYPAEFIYQNLSIATHLIHAAFSHGVKRLLYLGSSCIYPRLASQPIGEEELLQGPLEPTNEPYAIAKIAGIKLCESYNRQYGVSHGIDYRCVMPTNLYGPHDSYHPHNAHVIAALIRRFHEARVQGLSQVMIWGSGTARREFLYVDDLARACVQIMQIKAEQYRALVTPWQSHLNIGSGEEVTITELAQKIARTVGYTGQLVFDATHADGTPRKWLDSTRVRSLGWAPQVSLDQGLAMTYQDFLQGEHDR